MDSMAMTLRLTDEETEALRAAAELEGLSMQEFVRIAIRERVTGWSEQRDAFLRDFAATNKGLLDRLGQ